MARNQALSSGTIKTELLDGLSQSSHPKITWATNMISHHVIATLNYQKLITEIQ